MSIKAKLTIEQGLREFLVSSKAYMDSAAAPAHWFCIFLKPSSIIFFLLRRLQERMTNVVVIKSCATQ